jgi:hypothetical protein
MMTDGTACTRPKETVSGKMPGDAATTAPFTQPAASDGPDDKPTTASIAAAATSIDFITISFRVAHWLGGGPITLVECARACLSYVLAIAEHGEVRKLLTAGWNQRMLA